MDTTQHPPTSGDRRRRLVAAAVAASLTTAALIASDTAHSDRAAAASDAPTTVAAGAPRPTGAVVASDPPAATGVVTVGVTASQQEAIDHAIAWYDEMGLELPPITIRGGHRDTLCKGHWGLYVHRGDVTEVRICTRGGSWEQRVVLHELAHAWAYANVPSDRRDAFVSLRGLDAWHDEADSWERRGDEHAAEIIAWGVSAIPFPIVRIDDRNCAALRTGYVTLTGREPRQTDQGLCRPRVGATTR